MYEIMNEFIDEPDQYQQKVDQLMLWKNMSHVYKIPQISRINPVNKYLFA